MKTILVNRTGALGDVVLTTPIIRRLAQENPDAEIHVRTGQPEVFRNNPHVKRVWAPIDRPDHDRLIELDMVYERSPLMHIVNAYALEVFGEVLVCDNNRQQELFYPRKPKARNATPLVAVHAAKAGWRNRTLPAETWLAVCAALRDAGTQPLLVGTHRDELRGSGYTAFHHPSVLSQAAVIAQCDCFVGPDTGLLHVAGATDTPIVGVFTAVDPAYRLPYRVNCAVVQPDMACVGCHGRRVMPVTDESCEREDYAACVRAVSPEAIVEAVLSMLKATNCIKAPRAMREA